MSQIYLFSYINSSYCANPSRNGYPVESKESEILQLNFGITNFNTIYEALLTNLTFVTFTGWGMVTSMVFFS